MSIGRFTFIFSCFSRFNIVSLNLKISTLPIHCDHFSSNSTYLNKHCELGLNDCNSTRSQYYQIFDLAKNKYQSNFFIVDPVDIFCDINQNFCTPFKEGELLYSYTDHMALNPSLILGSRVNNLIHSLNASPASVPVVKSNLINKIRSK